ncbi:organic cation transporter protein-like [Asterias amurensis]|uniref:organic cation transporter protein-like n=1 Tax=Asterias amurensis TaxID=7602 RepID=UPI003AB791BB
MSKEQTDTNAQKSSALKFDDILFTVGEFGKWQKILCFLVSLIGIMTAMNTLGQVFMAADTDHWCRVAHWDKANCTTGQFDDWECLKAKRNASIPLIVTNKETGEKDYDSCHMYDVRKLEFKPGMNPTDYTNKIIDCSNGWVFDTTQYKTTIISEFELVCDAQTASSFLQSVYFAGLLFGSFFFGSVADWLGRKPTVFISTMLFMLASIGNTFSPNFFAYMLLRFFVAAGGIGSYLVAYVLACEFIGPNKRVLVGISVQIFPSIGLSILPLIAYFVPTWRPLQLLIAVPTFLYLLLYFYFPESARWQMSKGRYRQAETTLRKLAKSNKRDFPEDVFTNANIKAAQAETHSAAKQTAFGLFASPNMCIKTLNMMFNWAVNSMVYYGLGLSTSDLGVDDYVAAAISGLVEFPSLIFCLFALQYGRRYNLSGSMLIGGIACVTTAFLEMGIVRTVIAMIGKFCITASFATIYVVSGEIFPTPVRSAGMGLSSTAARVAGILSPYILQLKTVWEPLPFILFGSLSILAGLLALLLPETNHKKLPETLEEGEAFGKPRCLGGGDNEDNIAMVTMTTKDADLQQELDNHAYETTLEIDKKI